MIPQIFSTILADNWPLFALGGAASIGPMMMMALPILGLPLLGLPLLGLPLLGLPLLGIAALVGVPVLGIGALLLPAITEVIPTAPAGS